LLGYHEENENIVHGVALGVKQIKNQFPRKDSRAQFVNGEKERRARKGTGFLET